MALGSVVLDQAFTFAGDGATAGSTACVFVPESLRGQPLEYTFYAIYSASCSAGKVTVETADDLSYAGTWAAIGSTLDFVDNGQKYLQTSGPFCSVRMRISTSVVGGTVRARIIATTKG